MKGGRTTLETAKNCGCKSNFHWPITAALAIVSGQDFRHWIADGWASSTYDVCGTPMTARLSNGQGNSRPMREREIEKERAWLRWPYEGRESGLL